MSAQDHQYMARAIRLARRGLYTTHPNPRVGCVLVKEGRVIAEGYHLRSGEPHAERYALSKAGESAKGATAYVTLEPCDHQGRTPPCSEALIEAEIARVVVAMEDPNPKVSGRGLTRLRDAGIEVVCGLQEQSAAALNPGFIKRMRQGLPYVRCKLAMSLDGRTAMASGESQWITGEAARRDVQKLRAISSAVATGVDTVVADNPSLNVRLSPEELPGLPAGYLPLQPIRVVFDTNLRTPPDRSLLGLPGVTVIICGERQDIARRSQLEAAGALVIQRPQDGERVCLQAAFEYLASQEINDILLECGPTLAGAALQSGVVDELIIYMAPHLMGDSGRGLVHLPGIERLQDRLDFSIEKIRQIGPDVRLTLKPKQY